jgi:hypothetical protein
MRDHGPFNYLPAWGPRHIAAFLVCRLAGVILYFQGTGRHTPDEVKQMRREAIGVLVDLAEAAYAKTEKSSKDPFWIIGGKEPTEADFTLFGYLSGMLATLP